MAPPCPIPSRPSSKSICEFYFTELQKQLWQCKKCLKNKNKNGGWTNLLSHLQTCVGSDYETVFVDQKKAAASSSSFGGYFIRISEQEKQMYQWINFVVMKNLPVSFVDCPHTREISRLKPVSGKTLRGHILALRDILRETLRNELPQKFVIVFDGWSEGTQHYVGVAAAYIKTIDGKEVPMQTMLSMQPLLSHGIQGMRAKDHLEHLSRILELYGKTCADILCLVGDNCSVNQSMARTLNVPLIGCASHKFNLAVKRWIASQPDLMSIITKVRAATTLCDSLSSTLFSQPVPCLLLLITFRLVAS